MRLLIFGGTFDPPHRGHAALLAAAAERVRPDRILVIPAYHAPLKGFPSAPAAARAELVRLGIIQRLPSRWRGLARLDFSEMRARRRVYTVETLARLKATRPDDEIHFVCGADAAADFPRWKDPARLKRLATWWYGTRSGVRVRPPAFFRRVRGRFPDVSSTKLRTGLALDHPQDRMLFPEIAENIRRRGLYGLDVLKKLQDTLSPERYRHTLAVSALAEALARRHGQDPDKMRLAGLLHDCGRRFSPPLMAEYVRRRRLRVPEGPLTAGLEPILLHAYISEDLAKREFGISDPSILSAIRKHTLGDREMTPSDRLLYVADACSSDRSYRGASHTRRLAHRDLDAAFERCVAAKLSHALARRAWLHPLTISLWNSLAAR